jgi:hypothetical protein
MNPKADMGFGKEKNDSFDPIFMKSRARGHQFRGPKLNSPGKVLCRSQHQMSYGSAAWCQIGNL